ncbi:MAG: extracellular solute-binding protein [Butyrivibrio sp.]|nr:extracellular solute-binding protein [Butyrivibrio sp.]
MQKIFSCFNMNHRPAKAVFAALLAAALMLSGCGDSSEVSEASNGSGDFGISAEQTSISADPAVLHFNITEKSLPDPKTTFESNPENQGKNYISFMSDEDFAASPYADAKAALSPIDSFCAEGKLYFLYNVVYLSEGSADMPDYTGNYCLAVLDSPYEQWEYHIFPADTLANSSTYTPVVQRILAADGDGLYLLLTDGSIVFYGEDESVQFLDGIDANANLQYLYKLALYPAGENLYVIFSDGISGGSYTSYDKEQKPVLSQNLEHTVSGCILQDSRCFWYGFDEKGRLAVWDRLNGLPCYLLGDMVDAYEAFLLTRSDAGDFILANTRSIWAGDGSEPLEKVLNFAENGYVLDELLSIVPDESGGFSVIADFEDGLYLLSIAQTDAPDKQEIMLASSDTGSLEPVIAAFNRQSSEYRVVLVNPFDFEDVEAYRQQLEISTGGGPDLMDDWLINLEGCIQNGYLEPLDDIYEEPSDYWPAVSEGGKRDDVLYSVCYREVLSFLSVNKSLAGELESWDTVQMMEAVRKSSAESLQMGLDSMDIVLRYGLADLDNTQFIDYGAGVSHLAEQPFLDLLEFAKEYGDDLYYADANYEEAGDYYREGRLAAFYQTINSYSDFLFASACFQGQEVLIGMPSVRGRGIYMSSAQLCLNSSSSRKDGAKAFLRYLVSAEGQLKFFGNDSIQAGFSCRRDVVEKLLEEYQERPGGNGGWRGSSKWGIYVEHEPLSDDQTEQFMALFEDAGPEPQIPSEVESIVREELAPYFAGDYSAQEAAANLHNRVQLYLSE